MHVTPRRPTSLEAGAVPRPGSVAYLVVLLLAVPALLLPGTRLATAATALSVRAATAATPPSPALLRRATLPRAPRAGLTVVKAVVGVGAATTPAAPTASGGEPDATGAAESAPVALRPVSVRASQPAPPAAGRAAAAVQRGPPTGRAPAH